MNKLYLFVAILLLGVTHAYSQDKTVPDVRDQIMPGTITLLSGMMVKGYIKSNGRSNNQNICEFYRDQQDSRSKIIYRPDELLGYTIGDHQYHSMPYSGSASMIGRHKPDSRFIYLLKEGPVSTYLYWDGAAPVILWRRGDQEPIANIALQMAFQNNIMKLIAGDTNLAGRIQRNETGYQIANINNIISEYNSRATSKKMVASN